MRHATVFVVYALVALLLQSSIIPLIVGTAVTVELLVIYVVYLGMRRHSVGAVVAAFALGYLLDTTSGTLYGLNALALTLVYIVVYRISKHLWVHNAASQIVVVSLAVAVKQAVAMVVLALLWGTEKVSGFWTTALWSVVVTAFLSPLVFAILERGEEFAVQERE